MSIGKGIAIVGMLLSLSVVNWEIYQKEQVLAQGQTVFLKLAPVDPRSLMQGDYMALRFEMADQIATSLQTEFDDAAPNNRKTRDGYAVVSLDDKNIGKFSRLHDERALVSGEVLMRFRQRNGDIKFATNAFFFQEGHGARFEAAEYGKFAVAENGEILLVGLHNGNLQALATIPD